MEGARVGLRSTRARCLRPCRQQDAVPEHRDGSHCWMSLVGASEKPLFHGDGWQEHERKECQGRKGWQEYNLSAIYRFIWQRWAGLEARGPTPPVAHGVPHVQPIFQLSCAPVPTNVPLEA